MSDAPKTSKEWRGKIVVVTRQFSTMGGDKFNTGERLTVRKKLRDGTFELVRPKAVARASADFFECAEASHD